MATKPRLNDFEETLLEHMARSAVDLGTVFGIVGRYRGDASAEGVHRIGRALLASWIERGWLELASPDGKATAVRLQGLLAFVDAQATDGDAAGPTVWLQLTARARADVPGLPEPLADAPARTYPEIALELRQRDELEARLRERRTRLRRAGLVVLLTLILVALVWLYAWVGTRTCT